MKHLLLVGLLGALALSLSACGVEQVDEGYRGIKTRFGKVEGEPLDPGLYFYNPISTSIMELSVREEKIEGQTTAFTKDTQSVTIAYTVTAYPDQKKIGDLYKQFGKDFSGKLINQAILGSLKDSVGQYIADDLVSKREISKKTAEKEIQTALAERGIIVTRLDFTNLDFDDAYEKAVEAKVVAIQRAAESKNKTVQVEEEAKQVVAKSKADAEAMRIKSAALAQNKGLVGYELATRWNGELPKVITGGSSIMNFGDFLKEGK